MVLNSNGTRYGFTQFWLNASISRAYSQEVLDYHNISRFVLKVSRISDQTSYMAYSHIKLLKRYDKNVMRVYYYDSRLYEKYFYEVLDARTKGYLRNKLRKAGENFAIKTYFDRSLIVINAINIGKNLNKRISSYYSALRNYNFSDVSQNLTSLFVSAGDDETVLDDDLTMLDNGLNNYILKQYVLNRVNKVVDPNQARINKLIDESDLDIGISHYRNFGTRFTRLVNYRKHRWIKNNYFYAFKLKKLGIGSIVVRLLKKKKKLRKLRLILPTSIENNCFLKYEYYYFVRSALGLKAYRKIPYNKERVGRINSLKRKFGVLKRTYCTYKKEDENNVGVKPRIVNKSGPKFSNPNYKGKNFDPNYHLLSRAEKQALKEKKQKAFEYAVARSEGRVIKSEATNIAPKGSSSPKQISKNVSRHKSKNLKIEVAKKTPPRSSATYNSPFMAEYRINPPELLEENVLEYKSKKSDIRNRRRQQAYRDKEKAERAKSKRKDKFGVRKESSRETRQNLNLESDLDIVYEGEFYDANNVIKKTTNSSSKIDNKVITSLSDFYETNFDNFNNERMINETASYLESEKKAAEKKILKKGSSKFKSFSTYVKGDEFTLLEQEEDDFKFPLRDLPYYTSIKKLKDDIKSVSICTSGFTTSAVNNNGALTEPKNGFQSILFSKNIQKSKFAKRKVELWYKNKAFLPTENFSFLDALRKNFYNNFRETNFYFKHRILQNYYNELMTIGARAEFITHNYLIDYLSSYYDEINYFIPAKRIEASNDFTALAGGPIANLEDFKIRLSRYFFEVLNEPVLSYLNYHFSKEVPKILTDKSINTLIYVPKLLEYGNFNAILYARFVARRLKQRFNINETMKVLRNFLRSGHISGYLFVCSGRFSKKQRASVFKYRDGSVPLATFRTPVQHAQDLVRLRYGTCCIKVWVSYTIK